MSVVEIRNATKLVGKPGVDDLAGKSAALEVIDSFRIGADVERFGVSIVQIELQAVRHSTAQAELARIVRAIADGVPSVERRILRRVERVRSLLAIDSSACRVAAIGADQTRDIGVFESGSFVTGVECKQIVDRLRGGKSGGNAAGSLSPAKRARVTALGANLAWRKIRLQRVYVLPVRDWLNVLNRHAGAILLGKHGSGS